jgi:hypothetical protein
LTDDEDRLPGGQVGEGVGHGRQGDQTGAGYVTGGVLVGLSDVEDQGTVRVRGDELRNRDFTEHDVLLSGVVLVYPLGYINTTDHEWSRDPRREGRDRELTRWARHALEG